METPTCSVIIPHHTGRTLLQRCLTSVRASQGVSVELLVITSDPSYLSQEEDVQVYFLEDGPAAKRNLGVAKSHGEYLIFLDDDVEISPYCCYEFVKWFQEHPQCGMAFGKIYKMEEGRRDEFDACGSWITGTGFLWDRAGNGQRDRGQYNQATRCLSAKSATCAMPRTVFLHTGGFDKDYYILGEETDLAWRIWLQGLEVWYVPTAISWHAFGCESLKPKQEFYTDERIFYRGCKNYLSMLWTNLGPTRLATIFPPHVSAWFLAAVGFGLRGQWRVSLQIMRGLRDFCTSLPRLRHKRRTVQSLRTLSDHTLWPMISYSPPLRYYVDRLKRYLTQGLHG